MFHPRALLTLLGNYLLNCCSGDGFQEVTAGLSLHGDQHVQNHRRGPLYLKPLKQLNEAREVVGG